MAKILVHTLGSSGDLNPFLALAIELRRRGHDIQFALSPKFAEKARALGFAADVAGEDPDWNSDLLRRMLTAHTTQPISIMFKEALIPAIVPATLALEPLVREADLFLSHTIQLAAPAVAQRTGTPWVSASAATLIYETTAYPPPSVAWKGCPSRLSRLGWQIGYKLFSEMDALAAAEYRKLGVGPRPTIIAGGAYSRPLDAWPVVAVILPPPCRLAFLVPSRRLRPVGRRRPRPCCGSSRIGCSGKLNHPLHAWLVGSEPSR